MKRCSFSLFSLVVIVALALFLRIIWLDKVPIGISDDELDYVFNAKAVFLTGKDITGTWNPLLLTTPPLETPKGETPYLIVAPLIGPLPFSLFNARLPYAFFNTIFVVVLYLLAYRLFGKTPAIITGFVAAINPYMIYFGRTAFDAPLASLFFFFGLLILIVSRGWKILFAFLPFFLGFYSYIGTKLIFIPFTIICIFFSWFVINEKKYTKQYIVLAFLMVSIFVYYILSSMVFQTNKSSTRLSELATPFSSSVIQTVDEQRKLSVVNPAQELFTNKITVFTRQALEKYFGVFSTQFLFLYGDGRSTFSVWQHGMFYYLDLLFILIGLYALYKKNKQILFLLAAILFIAPLPSVASSVGTTYPIRSTLLFPALILLIGCGISHVISSVKFFSSKFLPIIITLLYIMLLSNFLYIYFFRNPVYNSEGFNFSARVLSRYIDLAKHEGQNVTIIADSTGIASSPSKQHLFYTNSYNRESAQEITYFLRNKVSKYGNLTITNCPEKFPNNTIITIYDSQCMNLGKNPNRLSIAQLSDGGEIYKIFNDRVCNEYKLGRYPTGVKLHDFEVEKLSKSEFCLKFITNLSPPSQSSPSAELRIGLN